MELLEKFHPKKLPDLKMIDFVQLSMSDYEQLAKAYPHMTGDLLIQKTDGSGIKSPATYRSFYALLKSGHKFQIVGTRYGSRKVVQKDVQKEAEKIAEVEFVKPPISIFPKEEPKKRRKKSKI